MHNSTSALPVEAIRDASRRLVRELGFMKPTLAGTRLPASAVHALIEIGDHGIHSASALCEVLQLEKSSVSRMVRKLIEAGEAMETSSQQDAREKQLALTVKGKQTLAAINQFARIQVCRALENIPSSTHGTVKEGLGLYAEALATVRKNVSLPVSTVFNDLSIQCGYCPGVLGRTIEMHAHYYSRNAGFGHFFEAKVASGMADFMGRLDAPRNQIWYAIKDGKIVATIAIDGEDLGSNIAHLRWFIVDDGLRGSGMGRRLLKEAVSFCDEQQFSEIQLWTFNGLDAARRLYEDAGFALIEELTGRQWGEEVIEQKFSRPRPITLSSSYSAE
ncbi:bifunctional helix-turn-helix transcriptional regulator/GNAT family N-acetyltransferase [Undibacterium pigrum]|uniref:MarR family transcriptional regulator with acetyltransferase activity n=1 Tax=Undibacterium pigrum TaxID=401470 RepID=A0A318K111_9BURK|nr:helix-turn-helix domain-containing GNAT family N-acetyltransferase [Undibacterium pigrum]PXX46984.1 MarR family transcriptional regulator with acetyltransferase activity [Undibacterium pigrum]